LPVYWAEPKPNRNLCVNGDVTALAQQRLQKLKAHSYPRVLWEKHPLVFSEGVNHTTLMVTTSKVGYGESSFRLM
jgi:hypothetical protein